MYKEYYKLDDNGYILDNYLGELDEDGKIIGEFNDLGINYCFECLPQPLPYYRPKWNGSQWVEGETQEEKELREFNELQYKLKPTEEELEEAKLEIKTIEILKSVGVI